MPPCTDSQCLTPTPEPGKAAPDQRPSRPAPKLTPFAADAATPGPAAAGANEIASPGDHLAFQSEPAAFGPVQWATEIDPDTHEPRQRVESIPADAPTIYAVFVVDRLAAGTTVQAQWSYNRTRLESFDQSMVVKSDAGNTWLEFHLALTQPGAWPSGQYDLTILVNGEPALTGSVEVIGAP